MDITKVKPLSIESVNFHKILIDDLRKMYQSIEKRTIETENRLQYFVRTR